MEMQTSLLGLRVPRSFALHMVRMWVSVEAEQSVDRDLSFWVRVARDGFFHPLTFRYCFSIAG